MAVELVVPSVGESITEVMIGEWLVEEGGSVQRDQAIVEIESDKATVELNAPSAGTVTQVLKKQGDMANVGEVIGYMEAGEASSDASKSEEPKEEPKEEAPKEEAAEDKAAESADGSDNGSPKQAPAEESEPAAAEPASESEGASEKPREMPHEEPAHEGETRIMPAAQQELDRHGLDAATVTATGPGGRLLKEDVLRHVKEGSASTKESEPEKAAPAKAEAAPAQASAPAPAPAKPAPAPPIASQPKVDTGHSRETRTTPITPMRKRIAERLVYAQQSGALLTTFNEIDMSGVMALRKEFQDEFTQKHGIKLGFMSFFIKACVDALQAFPQVNAEMQENQIVYYEYCDIGIAVGGGKGLVVPVIRNAETLGLAGLEKAIADFGKRARENKINLEELQGGTFSITNGGIFGSLMSTPILNPPQSAILGMHKIQDRPVAVNGEVVIRPMMYVALTYDHRIIDGREAVSFLVRIKENLERPERMLLDL